MSGRGLGAARFYAGGSFSLNDGRRAQNIRDRGGQKARCLHERHKLGGDVRSFYQTQKKEETAPLVVFAK